MKACATSFETASEDLLPKSTLRWEYDREVFEGPLCFILLYALSITQAPAKKRPQQQRVNAVVQRGNTVSRLDLSDLCFVDNLVSLLISWRKSQLPRSAEMV